VKQKKADGLIDEGTYFRKDPNSLEGNWIFKENVDLVHWLKLSKDGIGKRPEKEKEKVVDSEDHEVPEVPSPGKDRRHDTMLPGINEASPFVENTTPSPRISISTTTVTTTTTVATTTPTNISGATTPPAQLQEEPPTIVGGYSDDEWQDYSSDEPSDGEENPEEPQNPTSNVSGPTPASTYGNIPVTPGTTTSNTVGKDALIASKKNGKFYFDHSHFQERFQ